MLSLEKVFVAEVHTPQNLTAVRQRILYMLRKRDRGDLEDLVQSTFYRAWRGLPRFRRDAAFQTWLYRIATNVVLDHQRHKRAEASIDARDYDCDYDYEEDCLASLQNPHEWMDPYQYTLAGEMQRLGQSILKDLPKRYQIVLEMREQRRLRHKKIAALLGTTLGNSKNCAFRARNALRIGMKGVEISQ